MFSRVRLRLTLVYLVAALALVIAVAASAYGLLGHYFASSTDLALRYRMALEFRSLGLQPPSELVAAENAWFDTRARAAGSPFPLPVGPARGAGRGNREEDHDSHSRSEDPYDSQLASLFVLRLDRSGRPLPAPDGPAAPLAANAAAVRQATATGVDLRTVTIPDGRHARLLTYAALSPASASAAPGAVSLVQIGRLVTDEEAIMRQLLLALLALSSASVVVLAAASWLLAGWSLVPAQRAWERQRAFVANASHELRAPLTLLRASVEMALRDAAHASTAPAPVAVGDGAVTPAPVAAGRSGTDDLRALLGDALDECDHMARLVEDLLLLSRLDAGRLPLELSAVDVPQLLADVGRQVGRLAEERGVALDVAAPPAGALQAWADPARVRQVLLILVDNGLRHTPGGGQVHLAAAPHDGHVRLDVQDTGCGIAPEHLPHVFDRFYRAGATNRSADSGSGLGLAIAKGLVEAQHGTIRLESRLGAGTRVEVTLPAARLPV